MKKLRLYIDTSAIGYLDENDEKHSKDKEAMLALWEDIKSLKYDVIISELTFKELSDNENTEKVNTLLAFIAQIEHETIGITAEAEHIASLVKKSELLVSDKHQNDRLHIGCAFVTGCDVIVSMNFKHLVNVRTIRGVRAISSIEGYKNIDIVQPVALVDEEGAAWYDFCRRK